MGDWDKPVQDREPVELLLLYQPYPVPDHNNLQMKGVHTFHNSKTLILIME